MAIENDQSFSDNNSAKFLEKTNKFLFFNPIEETF